MLARSNDSVNAGETYAFDCRQTIANCTQQRSKAQIALVNIRWQQLNSLRSHLLSVTKHLCSILDFIGKNRCVEVLGKVGLQIRGLERQIGIGYAVGFGKTIIRKLLHQRENLLSLVALNP